MQQVIAARMTAFGQAGHAGDYDGRFPLEEMRERYASGAIA